MAVINAPRLPSVINSPSSQEVRSSWGQAAPQPLCGVHCGGTPAHCSWGHCISNSTQSLEQREPLRSQVNNWSGRRDVHHCQP